jgi:hypothetical protein
VICAKSLSDGRQGASPTRRNQYQTLDDDRYYRDPSPASDSIRCPGYENVRNAATQHNEDGGVDRLDVYHPQPHRHYVARQSNDTEGQGIFKLRRQLNCSNLKQIDQHALNTTSPDADALIRRYQFQ